MMNPVRTRQSRWAAAREAMHAARAARAEREALARTLAAYDSPADLTELAALLDRCGDTPETDAIRDLVDWTKAA